jgi:hypothetical protein
MILGDKPLIFEVVLSQENSKAEYAYGWYSASGGKNMICKPYYQG